MIPFQEKLNYEYNKLMNKYSEIYFMELESCPILVKNFYEFAIPSLLSILLRENLGFWKCKFHSCLYTKGFPTKRSLLVHLICSHGPQLTAGGIFLMPHEDHLQSNRCEECEAVFANEQQYELHTVMYHVQQLDMD